MMKRLTILAFILVMTLTTAIVGHEPALGQDNGEDTCAEDLVRADELLAEAQAALADNDLATARELTAEALAILERCEGATAEPTQTPAAVDETEQNGETDETTTPTPTPFPLPPSVNLELRQTLQQDLNVGIRLQINGTCFLSGEEIPGRITVQSFRSDSVYFYRRGNVLYSVNNSELLPNLPVPEPTAASEFAVMNDNDIIVLRQFEDLGQEIKGMAPTLDLGETVVGDVALVPFGLPIGEYWMTVVYTNDQDGLEQREDGTFLIPQAAWRGELVSPEVRFRVVNNLEDCDKPAIPELVAALSADEEDGAELSASPTPEVAVRPVDEDAPVICMVENRNNSQVTIHARATAGSGQVGVMMRGWTGDVLAVEPDDTSGLDNTWYWVRITGLGGALEGWINAEGVVELSESACPQPEE
jgi:hypothetical protein